MVSGRARPPSAAPAVVEAGEGDEPPVQREVVLGVGAARHERSVHVDGDPGVVLARHAPVDADGSVQEREVTHVPCPEGGEMDLGLYNEAWAGKWGFVPITGGSVNKNAGPESV